MNELFFETIDQLIPILEKKGVERCEEYVASKLSTLKTTPFHKVLEFDITNEPILAAEHFDRFFEWESRSKVIGAAYIEMNAFDINPDRWYCDGFVYEADGGNDDFDWLADFDESASTDQLQVDGLETLQRVFANEKFSEDVYDDARCLSSILVVLKFQKFIKQSIGLMSHCTFPVYASAHDFDLVARFDLKE